MSDVALVLIVILVLVIIWRGPKTLPKLGEAFGRGLREARREAGDLQADIRRRDEEAAAGRSVPPTAGPAEDPAARP
jgi:Sec-independent protein translocase protein TatA